MALVVLIDNLSEGRARQAGKRRDNLPLGWGGITRAVPKDNSPKGSAKAQPQEERTQRIDLCALYYLLLKKIMPFISGPKPEDLKGTKSY